jgi:REP element-mobilizing transposase RayT
MVRLSRISPADVPVHIIQRGNNRQVCFISDEDHEYGLKDRVKKKITSLWLLFIQPFFFNPAIPARST